MILSLVNKSAKERTEETKEHFKQKFFEVAAASFEYQKLEDQMRSYTELKRLKFDKEITRAQIKIRALEMWADFVCFYYSLQQKNDPRYQNAFLQFKNCMTQTATQEHFLIKE